MKRLLIAAVRRWLKRLDGVALKARRLDGCDEQSAHLGMGSTYEVANIG